MSGSLLNEARFSAPFSFSPKPETEAEKWLRRSKEEARKGNWKASRDFKKHYDKLKTAERKERNGKL